MPVHFPDHPPIRTVGCMCVSEEFTLTQTPQLFDLYTCNGTTWGLPHKLWIAELVSQGARGTIIVDTGVNQFDLFSVLPNKSATQIFYGMPMVDSMKIQVVCEGIVGQSLQAKAYFQIGGGLI